MSRFLEKEFGKCSSDKAELAILLSELVAYHPKDTVDRFERRLMAARNILAEIAPMTLASELAAASASVIPRGIEGGIIAQTTGRPGETIQKSYEREVTRPRNSED
jgi:hypothetical protein